MADPTRPSDIPFGLTLAELAQRQAEHCSVLFDHLYGFREPLTGPQRCGHALAELAYGTALATRAQAGQWVVVCEALDAGATHDQVGAAVGLDAEALRAELAGWAVAQHRQGRIDDARLAEVLALAEADRVAPVAGETTETGWAELFGLARDMVRHGRSPEQVQRWFDQTLDLLQRDPPPAGGEPTAGDPDRACLWCGTRPAPHAVLGDPLCQGCYADHRAETDRGAGS